MRCDDHLLACRQVRLLANRTCVTGGKAPPCGKHDTNVEGGGRGHSRRRDTVSLPATEQMLLAAVTVSLSLHVLRCPVTRDR